MRTYEWAKRRCGKNYSFIRNRIENFVYKYPPVCIHLYELSTPNPLIRNDNGEDDSLAMLFVRSAFKQMQNKQREKSVCIYIYKRIKTYFFYFHKNKWAWLYVHEHVCVCVFVWMRAYVRVCGSERPSLCWFQFCRPNVFLSSSFLFSLSIRAYSCVIRFIRRSFFFWFSILFHFATHRIPSTV